MNNLNKKREISELSPSNRNSSKASSPRSVNFASRTQNFEKNFSEFSPLPMQSLSPSSKSTNFNISFQNSTQEKYLSAIERVFLKLKIEIELVFHSNLNSEQKNELKEILTKYKNNLYEIIFEIENFFSTIAEKNLENANKVEGMNVGVMINEINQSRETIKLLQQDIKKKLPSMKKFEKKIERLTGENEKVVKEKQELQIRIEELIQEKNGLLESINNISSQVKNYDKNEFIYEETSIPSPFNSKSKLSFEETSEFIQSKLNFSSLKFENQQIQKELELSLHNYDNLCKKFQIQTQEFNKHKNYLESKEEFYSENLKKIRKTIFSIYLKINQKESSVTTSNTESVSNIIANIDQNVDDLFEKIRILEKNDEKSKVSHEKDKEKLADLQKQLEKLEKKNISLITDNRNLSIEIEKEKEKIIKFYDLKTKEKDNFESEIESQSSTINNLLTELQEKSNKILMYEQKLKQMQSENFALEEKIKFNEKDYIANLTSLSKENESIKLELNNLKQQKENEISKIEAKYALLHEKYQENEKNLQNLENALVMHESEHLKLSENSEQSKTFINTAEKLLEEKEKTINDLQNKLKVQVIVNKKLRDSIANTKSEVTQSYQVQLNEKIAKISEYEIKIGQMDQEIKDLQKLLKENEKKIVDQSNKILGSETDKKKLENLELKKKQIKEKYAQQKINIKRLEAIIIEKDFKYKELNDSQQNAIAKINESIKDLKKQIKEKYKKLMKQEMNQIQSHLNEKESEIMKLKLLNDDFKKKNSEKTEIINQKEKVIEQKEVQLENSYKKSKKLEENLEDNIKSMQQLSQSTQKHELENKNLIQKLEKLEMENEILSKEKESIEDELKKMTELYENSKNNQNLLNTSGDDEKSQHINKLLEELVSKESTIKKNNKRVLELQWKNRDLIETIKEYETNTSENAVKLEKLNIKIQDLINENDKLSSLNQGLKKEIKELQEISKNKSIEIEEQISDHHVTINVLQQNIKELSDQLSNLMAE